MTHAKFLQQAELARVFANECKALRDRAQQLMAHHYPNGFGAAGDDPKPDWINEDADGNIDGTDFTRQQYMTLFDVAFQLEAFFADGHGDSVEQVADA